MVESCDSDREGCTAVPLAYLGGSAHVATLEWSVSAVGFARAMILLDLISVVEIFCKIDKQSPLTVRACQAQDESVVGLLCCCSSCFVDLASCFAWDLDCVAWALPAQVIFQNTSSAKIFTKRE